MRPRTVLRQVHLWTGLVLSVLLLVLGITGSALVYKEAYWRAAYPALAVEPPSLTSADHAAAARAAVAAFGGRLRSVKLPEPGVPAYHLYLADGEAFLSVTDHRVIDEWAPLERPMSLLFDLHAHLMAGPVGERIGGVAGLLGGLLVVTGFILWWPSRRRFSLRALLPRRFVRRDLLLSHRDLGALTSPLLLILLLTGSGMVFYGTARWMLNGLYGDAVPGDPAPVAAAPGAHPAPDSLVFARAAGVLPDARTVFYYPPAPGSGVHGFRLKRPCELHPNGRSYVYLDAAGDVLDAVDACAAGPGERATHAIYPLHAGKTESGLYKLLVFIGGIALSLVAATGALSYLRALARAAARRGPTRPSGPPGSGRPGPRRSARTRMPIARASAGDREDRGA